MAGLFGGIEAGGTKFVCIAARGRAEIVAQATFPTTLPGETIARVNEFFQPYRKELIAIGIGSFGPVDLHPQSPTYGYITTTPKPGWAQTDLRGGVMNVLGVPTAFDTDVNAAAVGEYMFVPENKRCDPLLYITIGTGIGVGVLINGQPLHGLVHPEIGHMALPRDPQEDPFIGNCPYHRDCWEGLASGPAMAKRWGQPADQLPEDHPGWELEAGYIGRAIANLICAFSPLKVVLGGGVAQHPGLLDRVHDRTLSYLNGYVQSDLVLRRMQEYIVSPSLGTRSGSLGAVAMAMRLAGDPTVNAA
jgi:fructokinase